ncbi:Fe-S protein assembly co-chaperone HscB [Buchnera aphidicola]|uniref:Co-chaperone protein HscB n=1 Tax=Buchnera aphidicola str. USDA (Myzus persicae) TaxID=1009856 RepID=W0P369_BUCMP|nr:Fe-S protein assembly co-chaperone HscB [Buchnera aphidicola]AHG59810.1 Hscb [Buchnera aphidicola str. USDA (Myzus persicae)]AHG60390.1 Hscb [Buchnera aphidicola str. W106 (Myzus persicae)]AHG60963.1 Hscb [Buchnera aphidicola str. G002 (Myzus persicae)]AHG61535.1 Hscb [Buchnera aphidicola str. F009 (Myzus persicae)]WAI02950.1 MAG: Fe-S protein assembly co-chaperone HscB [Buchnera aphidicola (Myzus persicae)]
MNYFTLFDIPIKFKINKELLSKNFYKLQLQSHPDLFINESDLTKTIALEKSIEINKGYKILKNSLSRAIYLLSLYGFKLKTETILLKNNSFLKKYFSLYEDIDNLKKNNFNGKKVHFFLKKIEKKSKHYKTMMETEFENKNYEEIIPIIAKLLFFKKIKINLKKEQDIYLRKTN